MVAASAISVFFMLRSPSFLCCPDPSIKSWSILSRSRSLSDPQLMRRRAVFRAASASRGTASAAHPGKTNPTPSIRSAFQCSWRQPDPVFEANNNLRGNWCSSLALSAPSRCGEHCRSGRRTSRQINQPCLPGLHPISNVSRCFRRLRPKCEMQRTLRLPLRYGC